MDGAAFLPEFDQEFAEARRALERVPGDKLDFKPHEKSFSLHHLAAHIANIPRWVPMSLEIDVLDLDGFEAPAPPETVEAILAEFDEGLVAARGVLGSTSAETLASDWSMTQNGEVALSMPKGAVIRSFILNHLIHHRAQLGVYLRLLDVPVPGHYGPTADEQ